ncbi:MAG: 4Fe-4S dicluster domain-containing protein [Candidatus Bathyarchaeia archaeon]
MRFEVILDLVKCTGQAVCIAICPVGVYARDLNEDSKPVIANIEKCNGCGDCVQFCPQDALVVKNLVTGEMITQR